MTPGDFLDAGLLGEDKQTLDIGGQIQLQALLLEFVNDSVGGF